MNGRIITNLHGEFVVDTGFEEESISCRSELIGFLDVQNTLGLCLNGCVGRIENDDVRSKINWLWVGWNWADWFLSTLVLNFSISHGDDNFLVQMIE